MLHRLPFPGVAAAGQDRQNRRRAAVANAVGVAAGRAQGVFHGGAAKP